MGELNNALEEFSGISRKYHRKIMEILKEKYCWKCPMRSTSKKIACREIDTWIRLTGAFEKGVQENIISGDISKEELDVLSTRYLLKLVKKQKRAFKYDKTVILKLKEDLKPFAFKDDLIFVKENPESVKIDDLILWPQICPLSFYWFSKSKSPGIIPFKILKVQNLIQKKGHTYIKANDSLEIPLEYVTGKITKIIAKNEDLCSKLGI